jgi:hypothetical protein
MCLQHQVMSASDPQSGKQGGKPQSNREIKKNRQQQNKEEIDVVRYVLFVLLGYA